MTEKVFTTLADDLQKSISNDIAYIYSTLISNDTNDVLTKMKSDISQPDRHFIKNDLKEHTRTKLILPYDILTSKIKTHINHFYEEFDLSSQTLHHLSKYGTQADKFKNRFSETLQLSRETTIKKMQQELEKQIAQNQDVKNVIQHMQEQLQKRLLIVKKQLKQLAGQMKQYMVLWDYQEKGFTMYRLVTIGENCEDCTSRHGLVFPISEAECGVNLAPFHPNCDCKAEILDDRGKAFIAISPEPKEEKNTTETESGLDYLKTSLRQVLLGNYADDTNLGGTLGQITLGLLGLDLPADIRDLLYDVTNWQTSPEHILQTILDAAALLPIVGGIKYADETADTLKAVAKHGDEVADIPKIVDKTENARNIINKNSNTGTLSNLEVRIWYLQQEKNIPNLIDDNASLEQQAKQAFNLRNQYRTKARELMSDRSLADSLSQTDPNLTWEQIVQKQIDKGLAGDDVYKAIIDSSQRSRKSINQLFKLDQEE